MLFFHSKKEDEDNSALMAELARTKLALDTAYSNFENVVDPDLIDSCIYEVNAIQQRYRYLLKQLKMDETPVIAAKTQGDCARTAYRPDKTTRSRHETAPETDLRKIKRAAARREMIRDRAVLSLTHTLSAYI